MLSYWWIILIVAMMVGPLVWMQPSPRAREVAALRSRASARGMRVLFREHPDGRRRVAYGLPVVRWTQTWRMERGEMGWDLAALPSPLQGWWKNVVEHLPGDLDVVQLEQRVLWFHWREQEGIERVDQLADWLAEGVSLLESSVEKPSSRS